MSEPIKAGDLVVSVRHCCPKFLIGPTIFEVKALVHYRKSRCLFCGRDVPGGAQATGFQHAIGVPLLWLKKVPPIEEMDDVKREEEITA